MIGSKMEAAINEQINREMFSAYLYMAMSAKALEWGYKGISKWLMVQYHEEMVHAMKFYEYIQRQGGKVKLNAIKEPSGEYQSTLGMFEKVLEHENYITKSINELMDLAIAERDHASQAFVTWYVNEQVEEEENALDIIQQMKMIGDNKAALYMLDKELGMRVVNVPTDFSTGVEAGMAAGAGA